MVISMACWFGGSRPPPRTSFSSSAVETCSLEVMSGLPGVFHGQDAKVGAGRVEDRAVPDASDPLRSSEHSPSRSA